MESSRNQNVVKFGHQPNDIVDRIDLFFTLDAQMSAEEKLLEGLEWARESGFMSPEDVDECIRAYKSGYTATLGEVEVKTELL